MVNRLDPEFLSPSATNLDVLTTVDGETVWAAPTSGGGSGGAAIPVAVKQRAGTSLTFASDTWAAYDTATDLTLSDVSAGDVVELNLALRTPTVNNYLLFDVRTRVAGADVRRWDTAGTTPTSGDGFPGWAHAGNNTEQVTHSPMLWTVTAGDIAGDGSVTFRLYVRTGNTLTSRTVYSTAQIPLVFSAKHLRGSAAGAGVGDIDGGTWDTTYLDVIDGGSF